MYQLRRSAWFRRLKVVPLVALAALAVGGLALVGSQVAHATDYNCNAVDDATLRNCVTTGTDDASGALVAGDTVTVLVQNDFNILSTVTVPTSVTIFLLSDPAAIGGPFTLTRDATNLTAILFNVGNAGSSLEVTSLTLDGGNVEISGVSGVELGNPTASFTLGQDAVMQNFYNPSTDGLTGLLGSALTVYSGSVEVIANAKLLNNTARGGAAISTNFSTTPGITNVLVTDNAEIAGNNSFGTFTSINPPCGGAISINGDETVVTISGNAKIHDNQSDVQGGAICNDDEDTWPNILNITDNAEIYNNSTPGTWGGAILNNEHHETHISGNAKIYNNSAGSAASTIEGGAIYNAGLTTISGNAEVFDNLAQSPISGTNYGYGGALYNWTTGTVSISDNVQIYGNQAGVPSINRGDGGAIDNDGILTITGNVEINGNSSSYTGGAIASSNALIISGNVKINDNTATFGGGIYQEHYGTATAVGEIAGPVTISDNEVGNSGGGIYVYSGTLTLAADSTGQAPLISNNTAASHGGGIFNYATVEMDAGTIDGNTAVLGGGIYVSASATSTNLVSGLISNNTATGPDGPKGSGGGVYTDKLSLLTAGKGSGLVSFTGNTAPMLRTKQMILPGHSIDGAPTDDLTDYANNIGPASWVAAVTGVALDAAVMSSPIGVANNAPAYNNYDINYAFPQIELVKTVSPSDSASFKEGQKLTYSYQVTNSGSATLDPVAISDPKPGLSAVNCPGTSLAVGASMTCTATYTVTLADLDAGFVTNTATASGQLPDGRTTQDTDTVTLRGVPSISLIKMASPHSLADFKAGQVITYAFHVHNTGTTPLSDVTVSDPLPGLSAIACPHGVLLPGANMLCHATYTITQADQAAGSLTNTAVATGTPPTGRPVQGSHSLTIPDPAGIRVVKSASPDDTAHFNAGQVITYSFLVTNTGEELLNPVVVSDPMRGLSPVSCPESRLASGASMTCTATYTITDADVAAGHLYNAVLATGTRPSGGLVHGSDHLTLPVLPTDNAPPIAKTGGSIIPADPSRGDAGLIGLLLLIAGLALADVWWARRRAHHQPKHA